MTVVSFHVKLLIIISHDAQILKGDNRSLTPYFFKQLNSILYDINMCIMCVAMLRDIDEFYFLF